MRHPRATARGSGGACADQARIRGGWSGGGRSSPSAKTSSRSACAGPDRMAHRQGRVAGGWPGPSSGRTSRQRTVRHALLFCSSGQQGMSADIDDMSAMSAHVGHSGGHCACIAAGVATGQGTVPTMTAIASNRAMRRRKSISYPHTAEGRWKGRRFTFAAGRERH